MSLAELQKESHAKKIYLAARYSRIDELTQAVPPCYTEYIGRYLKEEVTRGTR